MWPLKEEQEYESVAAEEGETSRGGEHIQDDRGRRTRRKGQVDICRVVGSIAALLFAALAGAAFATFLMEDHHDTLPSVPGSVAFVPTYTPVQPVESAKPKPVKTSSCAQRKEWRSLSLEDQEAYISAVLCLKDLYSGIASESRAMSAYDDFPTIYGHFGFSTAQTAAYLPWHRWFLHLYEHTLRHRCAFRGNIPYWDWTLDHAALENSPVFSPDTGFGGDRNASAETKVGETGGCISSGPFASHQVAYYDAPYEPHCLSRGFRDLNGHVGHIDGSNVSPPSIAEVLSQPTFEAFANLTVNRLDAAVRFGIGGDFDAPTAPHDPLFYLHHAQLDRLWWQWQQEQPDGGLESYGGVGGEPLEDMLIFGGSIEFADGVVYKPMSKDVSVMTVMDIEHGDLCYRY